MKIRNALLTVTAAALMAPVAFGATMATKEDCTAAQKKADAALAANPHAKARSTDLRAEGEKLCHSGKSVEGVKKLDEAAKEAHGTIKVILNTTREGRSRRMGRPSPGRPILLDILYLSRPWTPSRPDRS